ncbi:transporter substrate-binding domain-containing protein [Fulvivirgaceae bacterium BMA12]|uniref:Transporter substrate-binding domain-containing protein n=1 Tax=Agaribacillus aureus TaxID=3051825 RepID=A0ABT8LCP7_9BACT|nr:transporter substrate-binding domain-containing protein [Fulvivirgaceae bacterium BMA12]
MKRRYLAYLALVFCWVLQGCQFSKSDVSTLDKVLKRGILRVGTTGDYPPFTYLNDQLAYEGIDIELAHNLAATLDAEIQFVPTTWATLLEDLQDDKFDIAMGGISKKLVRQQVGLFSVGYHLGGKTPIAKCEDTIRYNSLEKIDQVGVRIIVNFGGTNQDFIKKNIKKATVQIHDDNTTIFQQLANGKADVMITDVAEVLFQSKKNPKLCAAMPGELLDKFQMGYLMPRDLIWKAYVDEWIAHQMLENKIEKIFSAHLD